MLFPTTIFAFFFATVFFAYWAFEPLPRLRKWLLLAASFFFYAWWSWKFALLTLAVAALNHVAARPSRRLLGWAVAANLALLGVFKYTTFLFHSVFVQAALPVCKRLGNMEGLLDLIDTVDPVISGIVLPIGISFYTFQAIAYLVDVSRGTCRPARSFVDFANYLMFFPKLLAGPIVRPGELLPAMETLPARGTALDTGRAGTLIAVGLFKKTILANFLSQRIVDPFFADPSSFGALDAVLGTFGYTLQIYCDFSAYTDMAIGVALLLGFSFPLNFDAPYFSTTLQEFWRRWHISLSSWLRDYLYIPLGGSRCSRWRSSLNLFLTMLLGGLWHGAGWMFVLWGAFHGAYLALERPFLKKRPKGAPPEPRTALGAIRSLVGGVWIFLVVTFGWVLFRLGTGGLHFDTFRELFTAFGRARGPDGPLVSGAVLATTLVVMALSFLVQFCDGSRLRRVWDAVNRLPVLAQALLFALVFTILLGFGPSGVAAFIYFQF